MAKCVLVLVCNRSCHPNQYIYFVQSVLLPLHNATFRKRSSPFILLFGCNSRCFVTMAAAATLLLMCNGTHEIHIKDQTCSIMDEYVMSSRGICRKRASERKIAMQRNTTQWLMISMSFRFHPSWCVSVHVYYSNHLFFNAHCLYSPSSVQANRTRIGKQARKLLISIHTACKWISENCEKGGAHGFYLHSFYVGTIRYEDAPKTKSNRNDAYIEMYTRARAHSHTCK